MQNQSTQKEHNILYITDQKNYYNIHGMGEYRRKGTNKLTSFIHYSRTFHPDNIVIEQKDTKIRFTIDTYPGGRWGC